MSSKAAFPVQSLGPLVEITSGKRNSWEAVADGPYPFFTCAREILRIDVAEHDREAVLLGGNNANAVFPVFYVNGKFTARQRVYIIWSRDVRQLDNRFLYYVLRHLASSFTASAQGTTTLFITLPMLKALKIPVPKINVQRAAADVLQSLDRRIELLLETNATLQSVAQTVFKSWFVDFDPVRAKVDGNELDGVTREVVSLFPSEFQESPLGPVPKGWQIGRFRDLAEQAKGTVNPFNEPNECFEHYSLPAFDSNQLPVFERGDAIKSNKTRLPVGAVLQSKLNPHIPRVWLPTKIGRRAICSTEFLPWVAKQNASPELVYCTLTSSAFQSSVRTLVTGTSNSHQRVKPDQVGALELVLAPPRVCSAFTDIVRPLLAKVDHNRWTARTLADLRDTLLPRVVSGTLHAREAEAQVDELFA